MLECQSTGRQTTAMPAPSLETIYRTHRQGLFTLALSITGCQSSAEDSVHRAFTNLSKQPLDQLPDPVAYVYRSVRNASLDTRRRSKRHEMLRESIFNGFVPPKAECFQQPDSNVLTAERDSLLRKSIDELPEPCRQIVLLKTFSALTFDQVSEVLSIPAKTVATRYRRALQTLHQKLKGQL